MLLDNSQTSHTHRATFCNDDDQLIHTAFSPPSLVVWYFLSSNLKHHWKILINNFTCSTFLRAWKPSTFSSSTPSSSYFHQQQQHYSSVSFLSPNHRKIVSFTTLFNGLRLLFFFCLLNFVFSVYSCRFLLHILFCPFFWVYSFSLYLLMKLSILLLGLFLLLLWSDCSPNFFNFSTIQRCVPITKSA
jgi:hypothetical protein